MTKYRFIGDGAGIPGLPREVTETDLSQMNDEQRAELDEALAMGFYIEIENDQGE